MGAFAVAAISYGLSALGTYSSNKHKAEETYANASYQKELLKTQLEQKNKTFQYESSLAKNNYSMALAQRTSTASANSYSATVSNGSAYYGMNQTISNSIATVGAAISQSALSGFRNSGTISERNSQTIQNANDLVAMTRSNTMQTIADTYSQARASYLNASEQMLGYQQTLDRLTQQNKNDNELLTAQINYYQGVMDASNEYSGFSLQNLHDALVLNSSQAYSTYAQIKAQEKK